MTFATNFIASVLSAAFAGRIIGGPWWAEAGVGLLTGFVVMTALIHVNPKSG